MATTSFTINGKAVAVEADRDTPLLYVLRNDLGLKGARYGCGIGLCGACSVLMDGNRIFSCDTPVWAVEGKAVVTVEGLAEGGTLHPLQEAFIREQAGQCGYCVNGIIVAAKAFLDRNPAASDDEICAALDRNLCRCGAHVRMIRAIRAAADVMAGGAPS